MCMCVCIFAIFLDILSEKVTALLSFVFVDSVPKIKANLCVCVCVCVFFSYIFHNDCGCSRPNAVSIAVSELWFRNMAFSIRVHL